jgi:hypothetical protein
MIKKDVVGKASPLTRTQPGTLDLPEYPIPQDYVLPKHWQWKSLNKICTGIYDCPHSTPKLANDGPFVVRTQDILSGIFDTQQAARVSKSTYQERISRAARTHPRLPAPKTTVWGNIGG